MSPATAALWRVFPYDLIGAPGEPFSAALVPPRQGAGRFDVPDLSPAWYFGESAVHAVAETIQGLRGQTLDAADLVRSGFPLARVAARLPAAIAAGIVDLCDSAELMARGIRPDHLASRDRVTTQQIARDLAAERVPGFRWWSSLAGDWHATILVQAHLPPDALTFDEPVALTLDDPAVRAVCQALAIPLAPQSVAPSLRR